MQNPITIGDLELYQHHRHRDPNYRAKFKIDESTKSVKPQLGEFTLVPRNIESPEDGAIPIEIDGLNRYWFDWENSGDCTNVALRNFLNLPTTDHAVRLHRDSLDTTLLERRHLAWRSFRGYIELDLRPIVVDGAPVAAILGMFQRGIIEFSSYAHVAYFENRVIFDVDGTGHGYRDYRLDSVARVWVNRKDVAAYEEQWKLHSNNGGGANDGWDTGACSNAVECGCSTYNDVATELKAEISDQIAELKETLQSVENNSIKELDGIKLSAKVRRELTDGLVCELAELECERAAL